MTTWSSTVRVVKQTDWIWMQGGIAGTDVASLCNCAARSEEDCYWLLARKCSMQVMQTLRAELKREEKMRKQNEMVQGTPEWHLSRHGSIGGTEAAALVGAAYRDSKTLSAARRLWEEKTGPVKSGGGYENENMKRGKALEPIARQRYETLMDWSATPMCVLHDDYDFVRASLDGLRQDDGLVLEIKCPGLTNHYKFLEISKIAEPFERQSWFAESFNYYRAQVLYQLLITNSPVAHFVSYNEEADGVENKMALIEIYPEPDFQQMLLDRAIEFWGFVSRRELPPESWLRPCHFAPRNLQVPSSS